MAEKVRPSGLIEVGPTTRRNHETPLYIGHVDNSAYHADLRGARIESLDLALLGTPLNSFVTGRDGTPVRQSPFQANTGGYLQTNTKLFVDNHFPYIEAQDDHHPPADWTTFAQRLKNYEGYMQSVMRDHPGVYHTVRDQEGLVTAMTTVGRIGRLVSIEGMPAHIDVPVGQAAQDLAKIGTQVVNLMWNYKTDVGDTHGTSEDSGLSKKGEELLKASVDHGIHVFDVSHASKKTALGMLNIIKNTNGKVIASHTGARIGEVKGKTRNITDKVAEAIFAEGGIIGVATAGGMLADTSKGPANVEHVVKAIDHFVQLDPTGGKLVTLGLDLNGIGLSSEVKGAATILEIKNIAEALKKRGYSDAMIEGIFWKNGYDFWHGVYGDAQNAS